MFETVLFYAFATVLVVSAVAIITVRNPVHAVLCMVLCFFTTAGLWLLLRAEFLAIALVLVYVGAVMVLFLFVVMMLDVNIEQLRAGIWKNLPLALVVGGIMILEMVAILARQYFGGLAPREAGPGYSNTKELGMVLYTSRRDHRGDRAHPAPAQGHAPPEPLGPDSRAARGARAARVDGGGEGRVTTCPPRDEGAT